MSLATQYAENEETAARLILAHNYVIDLINGSFDVQGWKGRLDRDQIWDPILQIVHAHEAAIEQIGTQMKLARVASEVAAAAERMLPDDNRSAP